MLDSLKRIANNARKLNRSRMIEQALSNSSIQQDIIALNTEDQLYDKGIRTDGTSLGEYATSTIEGGKNFLGKKQKGQRYDHITLSDTFEFYDSFKIKNQKEEFRIAADPIKNATTDLTDIYGDNIIGLTDENIKKVAGWILPMVQEKISEQLRK